MDQKHIEIIKNVIKEAALAVDVAPPPAIYGQRIPGVKQQQAPTRISGQASGRFGPGGSGWTATKTIPRAAPMSKPTSRLGPGAGATQATPKVSSGGIGKAEYMGRNLPSFMKDKMDTVSRQMSKGFVPAAVTKAAGPALGRAAGALGGLGGAAATTLGPELGKLAQASHKAGHQNFKPHSDSGEAYSEVSKRMKQPEQQKPQGRSIDQYMQDVFAPKKTEIPKAPEYPKADVPKPPSRPTDFTFGSAFGKAREKAAGPAGSFEYTKSSGETGVYHTGYKGETVPKKLTPVESESGGKTVKKIKEDVNEATYNGRKVSLNKPFRTPGGPKKSAVYVDPDGDGKAKIVRFGDPHLSIKKDQPARKRSYCARSSGQGNLTKKDSANYWSRKAWNCEETEMNELSSETLSSYVKGAEKEIERVKARQFKDPGSIAPSDDRLMQQRKTGIEAAKGKMQEMTAPLGTTGKRSKWSAPMVPVRMASGEIKMLPPGKSGSSGGGGNGAE